MPYQNVIVKRAVINAASSGDNQIVAAVTGKKIKILSMLLIATEAVSVTVYSGLQATGDALTGAIGLGDNGGFVLNSPTNEWMHWMETTAGAKLNLYLSAAKQVSGTVLYYEE